MTVRISLDDSEYGTTYGFSMGDGALGKLSHSQFMARLAATGGATRNAFTNRVPPSHGYMSGTGKYEDELPREPSEVDVAQHQTRIVNDSGAREQRQESFQGAWHETGTSGTTVEMSRYFQHRTKAVEYGRDDSDKKRQVAIYGLSAGGKDDQGNPRGRNILLDDTRPGDRVVGSGSGLSDVTHRGSPERGWDEIETPVLSKDRPKGPPKSRTVLSWRKP